MLPDDLKKRIKLFAINTIKLCRRLPSSDENKVIKYQLAKSGTSVGANYRAACRARSQNEFISKLCIVNEEADESCFWLEVITESEILSDVETFKHLKEAKELNAIFTASSNTARKNRNNKSKDESDAKNT